MRTLYVFKFNKNQKHTHSLLQTFSPYKIDAIPQALRTFVVDRANLCWVRTRLKIKIKISQSKNYLTMFLKIILGLVDIPAMITSYQHQPEHVPNTPWNCFRSLFPANRISLGFFLILSVVGNVAEAPSLVSFKQELSSLSI